MHRDRLAVFENLRAFLARGKELPCTLLQLPEHPTDQQVAMFEHIVKNLKLASGVYRTTYRHRFCQLDEVVLELLRASFETTAPLEAHDWGVSDGVTTAEWVNQLRTHFPHVQMSGSDLLFHLIRI